MNKLSIKVTRLQQLRAGWTMMEPAERKHAKKISFAVLILSAIDIIALSSILPLLGLITAPDIWADKPILSDILHAFGDPELQTVIPTLAILIASFLLVTAFGNVTVRHLINKFGARCMSRLASEISTQISHAPLTWFLDRNSSVVARQINQDIGRWGNYFIVRLFNIVQTLTLTIIAAILIISLAPFAGIATLISAAILFAILMKVLRPRMDRYARVELNKSDAAMVSLLQMLNGIKDVKLSHCSSFFVTLFSDAFATISDITARRGTIQQALPMFLLVFGQLGIITIVTLLWIAKIPAAQIIEQTALIALIASRLVPALNRIFSDVALLLDSYPAINGLSKLRASLGRSIEQDSHGNNTLPENFSWSKIIFDNVNYTYPGAANASLRDISTCFERGKAYGLAGASGAGKTTLADILLGLLTPTTGSVMIGDINLAEIEPSGWQRHIGYVSQHPFITDDTLRANIAFGIAQEHVDDAHVKACMELANIADLADSLPQGLSTPLGDRGTKVSGGQRQRIAIARALYKKPDILILDEATSALDSINEAEVQKAIRNLHRKITTVIIAHRLSTISWCDEIILLSEGRIVGHDTFMNLKRENTLFRKMVDLNHSDGKAS